MADSDTLCQAYISASDEDRLRMEDLIHHLEYCEVPQQDRKFYLLEPTAWDWNDSYSSGLNDGVEVILTAPTISKPICLKSNQQRAIFKQLRINFRVIKNAEKEVERFENRIEETDSDDDFLFIMFLLQAEGRRAEAEEELMEASRKLEHTCLNSEGFSELVLDNILSHTNTQAVKT